jgi:hypothetical protein
MKARMILPIYTTGLHGIFAFEAYKILGAGAVLKVLVVRNVQPYSSKLGSILLNKCLHMGVLVGPRATGSPILALQLTRLASHSLSALTVFTVSELAVSSVEPIETTALVVCFLGTCSIVCTECRGRCIIIVVANTGTLDFAVASVMVRKDAS